MTIKVLTVLQTKLLIFIGLFAAYAILLLSLGIGIESFFEVRFNWALLFSDTLISLIRVTLITIISWLLAMLSSRILFRKKSSQFFLHFINFIRHISPFAWLPFAIIWFGLGELPLYFVLFIGSYFSLVIMFHETFSNIEKEYLDEAAVLGATPFQTFFQIEIPLAAKELLNHFRLTWGICWVTLVAAEMLGVSSGIGFRLMEFRYLLQYQNMAVYFVTSGAVGIGFDISIMKLIDSFFNN